MDAPKYIKLFASCITVKGANRSIICDFQRTIFYFVPNQLVDILHQLEQKSYQELMQIYHSEEQQSIQEYLNFLLAKELIFFCTKDELDHFPPMSLAWDSPLTFENAIIDIESLDLINLQGLLKDLDSFGCHYIQFRFFKQQEENYLIELLNEIKKGKYKGVEFIYPYSEKSLDFIKSIAINYPRLSSTYFYNAPNNKVVFEGALRILLQDDQIINEQSCGIVNQAYFSLDFTAFAEAKHYNSCLNRKISIDRKGNIKNCPSMKQSFGNIRDTRLREAIIHPKFKKLWNVTKDQITTCQDCEFRYICTDCRAYLENPENIYSKPLKCGYNPYTNEWSEWSKNPLKQKAIQYYQMNEIEAKETVTSL